MDGSSSRSAADQPTSNDVDQGEPIVGQATQFLKLFDRTPGTNAHV